MTTMFSIALGWGYIALAVYALARWGNIGE